MNSSSIPTNQAVDKFVVRFPRYLKQAIANSSATNHRSMNAEIVMRLEDSINNEIAKDTDQHKNLVHEPNRLTDEEVFKEELTAFETRLIVFYRRLSGDKKKALLSLFAN